MSSVEPYPAEIAEAVVEVMGKIKRLSKSSQNKFGNYEYASVDAFFEAVNPLMAEAGIFVQLDEISYETKEVTVQRDRGESIRTLLFITFDVYLCHKSGVRATPVRRSVNVGAGGAQEWGSAQSYLLKQFLRALFLIPTGDPEADETGPIEVAAPKVLNAKESKKLADEFIAALESAIDKQAAYDDFRHSEGKTLTRADKMRVHTVFTDLTKPPEGEGKNE